MLNVRSKAYVNGQQDRDVREVPFFRRCWGLNDIQYAFGLEIKYLRAFLGLTRLSPARFRSLTLAIAFSENEKNVQDRVSTTLGSG